MNIKNKKNPYMRHLPIDRISKAELAAVAVSFGARIAGHADQLEAGAAEVIRELWALHDNGIIDRPRVPLPCSSEAARSRAARNQEKNHDPN